MRSEGIIIILRIDHQAAAGVRVLSPFRSVQIHHILDSQIYLGCAPVPFGLCLSFF